MFVTDDTSVKVQHHAMPRPDSDHADTLTGSLAAVLDAYCEQHATMTPGDVRVGVESFAGAVCAVLDRQGPGDRASRRRRPARRRQP